MTERGQQISAWFSQTRLEEWVARRTIAVLIQELHP
jgi:hypothetical protein